jgi:hypothetical protein
MIEGDIPSIQCKMNLRGPKSKRKVDGLSLIFIDFYVAAPVLYVRLTLKVPNLISIFFRLGRLSKESVQASCGLS